MNPGELRCRLDGYLALRRAFGFAMRQEERLLWDFVAFVERHGSPPRVRAALAVEWAASATARRGTHARRLSVVRGFLTHVHALDPQVEVPGPRQFGHAVRATPRIYTAAEIDALIAAARTLRPNGSLRPHTMATLIGLLACCGLRAGEALRLRVTDVDLEGAPPHVIVRQTKFRKSRIVPVHPTTAAALRDYAARRVQLGDDGGGDRFFVSERGTPLNYTVTARTFVALARRLGLRGPIGTRGASLHGLRHTFAVSRLAAWSRTGADVRARLPELAVYLGHVRPQETYWYLTATPAVLQPAAARFETYATREVRDV